MGCAGREGRAVTQQRSWGQESIPLTGEQNEEGLGGNDSRPRATPELVRYNAATKLGSGVDSVDGGTKWGGSWRKGFPTPGLPGTVEMSRSNEAGVRSRFR